MKERDRTTSASQAYWFTAIASSVVLAASATCVAIHAIDPLATPNQSTAEQTSDAPAPLSDAATRMTAGGWGRAKLGNDALSRLSDIGGD